MPRSSNESSTRRFPCDWPSCKWIELQSKSRSTEAFFYTHWTKPHVCPVLNIPVVGKDLDM
ncbi:hypothetical protein QL093DRAFT_2484401 [Fusarium oxysporum]|nr:hypothetical protein QL093DRAFT_2484401 [Fusarium oxysporum]